MTCAGCMASLHWFTHFGQRPMVDQPIRCEQLSSDLEKC